MRLEKIQNNLTRININCNNLFFSYEILIAVYKDFKLYINSDIYSLTTRKHLNIIKKLDFLIDKETIILNEEELNKLI